MKTSQHKLVGTGFSYDQEKVFLLFWNCGMKKWFCKDRIDNEICINVFTYALKIEYIYVHVRGVSMDYVCR